MSPCHCQCQLDQDTVLQNKIDVNYSIRRWYKYETRQNLVSYSSLFFLYASAVLHLNEKACSHSGYIYALLTPANWWCRLKCCRVSIRLCACRGITSNQLKARITDVCSSVTNAVASQYHHAIVNVNRIRTQCYRVRFMWSK